MGKLLAETVPPTRGCRMTAEAHITIGNTANMPEANEPMLELAPVTITTTIAADSARMGISQAVRANFGGGPMVR